MAMRRKNFSSKKTGTDDVIMLDLNEGEPTATSFKCASKIPGMVLMDFMTDMDESDAKGMAKILDSLFKESLGDEFDRFKLYCRDPKNEVELDILAEMAGWLAEQYSGGNPTTQSPASSDGLPETGLSNLAVPVETAAI